MPKGQIKRKKTEATVQNIITAIKNGLHRDSACAVSKVPRSTFYERMKDEKFRTEIEEAEEFWLGIVERQKNKLIQGGHRPAIEKELKSKRRDVYGDKIEDKEFNINVVIKNYNEGT